MRFSTAEARGPSIHYLHVRGDYTVVVHMECLGGDYIWEEGGGGNYPWEFMVLFL